MLAAVLPVVAVLGFFVIRDLWWAMRPTPEFASLVTDPDTSLVGTVAFQAPYPSENCVSVVAAAGGEPRRVACVDGFEGGGELAWRDDGRLLYTHRPAADGADDTTRSVVIDVATGDYDEAPAEDIPARSEFVEFPPGPNGEIIETSSGHGRLTISLTTGGTVRRLLSVTAPYTYTLQGPLWSADGSFVVLKDDLDRLILVTTADPSTTRVLAEQAWGAAVTDLPLDALLAGG